MTAGNSHYTSGFLRQAWQASSSYSVNGVNYIACSLGCFPECINTLGFKGNIEANICAPIKYHCGTREILHTLALAIWELEASFLFFGLIMLQSTGLLRYNSWTKSICMAGLTLLSYIRAALVGFWVFWSKQLLSRWTGVHGGAELAVKLSPSCLCSQQLPRAHEDGTGRFSFRFCCRGGITDSRGEQSLWEQQVQPHLGALMVHLYKV